MIMFDIKKIIPCIMMIGLVQGCVSVDKYNKQINNLRSVNELTSDVEYAQHKLESLHPDLYHYITKKDLEYKFDSLKSSFINPMTSYDFYFRLSPVIASIKQGHTQTLPLTKKLKHKEKILVKKYGTSPLSQYDYELFNDRLYIIKNNSSDSTIKTGTEVLSVNGINPIELITKYKNTFTSDGSNITFFSRKLAKGFPRYFYYETGIQDSVICQLKYKEIYRTITLKRPVISTKTGTGKSKEVTGTDLKLQKKESQKRRLHGYDPLKKVYSKMLTFPVQDSSVAVMKINDFMKGNYRKFYKQSFRLMDSLHTKTLILDLRDNGGGLIRDINILYSYLADSSYHLIEKPVVTSKTSLWHFGYYNNNPFWVQVIQTIFLPVVLEIDAITYLKTRKDSDNKYRFAIRESRLTHPSNHRFKGKVYVLINGGSYSATCLLSSNMKGSKRATFVGQETGGADNGCVAGIMPVRSLPASKVQVRIGLLECKTPYPSLMDGRGIFPDVEITPTLNDRLSGNDPELQWVLKDIDQKNQNKNL